ncbi:30S ribosomal protein S8 [Candidatus Woesebacteria bacterium]|nr:30S ribosomal protein S8 [Candidatus Woesebacteria bacterium]QQG47795.1 MAG: 30S ribosomal protein S8 [Candidatus Woesebacteria bacterium]
MTNYKVGDFLIQVKNAARAKKKELTLDSTKLIKAVCAVLKKEGVIDSFEEKEGLLKIKLSYKRKEPVLFDLKLVSKPGLRVYKNAEEILFRKDKSSIFILSTSKGVISSNDVEKLKVGGELIAKIY